MWNIRIGLTVTVDHSQLSTWWRAVRRSRIQQLIYHLNWPDWWITWWNWSEKSFKWRINKRNEAWNSTVCQSAGSWRSIKEVNVFSAINYNNLPIYKLTKTCVKIAMAIDVDRNRFEFWKTIHHSGWQTEQQQRHTKINLQNAFRILHLHRFASCVLLGKFKLV